MKAKRIISILLIILMCLAFAACMNNNNNDKDVDNKILQPIYTPFATDILPIIRINTDTGKSITGNRLNQEYVMCTVSVDGEGDRYDVDGAAAQVKVRGNYTANYEKKPYRIKYNEQQAMLGLNGGKKYKNWVLLADYKDSSMLRNSIAFYFGKNILGEHGYYSADYRYVEVYINSSYNGMYVLTEQQQVNEGRVNVAEPTNNYTDTHIGYFFEYDGYYTEEAPDETFTMNYDNVRLTKKDGRTTNYFGNPGYTIKSDLYSTKQRDFIADYTRKVFRIAYKAAYENDLYAFDINYNLVPSASKSVKNTVEAVLDVRSLVDMYIIQEICCDHDISWSSFYLSADLSEKGNKKLTFQAPWDFDSALGLSYTDNKTLYAANSDNPWLILLGTQEWFWVMIEERWLEISDMRVFETALAYIDLYAEIYEDYYAKNYTCWPNSMGVKHDPRITSKVTQFKVQADAAEYLYNWLDTRISYLNSIFL